MDVAVALPRRLFAAQLRIGACGWESHVSCDARLAVRLWAKSGVSKDGDANADAVPGGFRCECSYLRSYKDWEEVSKEGRW